MVACVPGVDRTLRLGRRGSERRHLGVRDPVGLPGDGGGRDHEAVDAEAAEDVLVVLLRLDDVGIRRDGATLLQERLDVGAEVGAERGLPGSEIGRRADTGDGRVEAGDPLLDRRGRLALHARECRGRRRRGVCPDVLRERRPSGAARSRGSRGAGKGDGRRPQRSRGHGGRAQAGQVRSHARHGAPLVGVDVIAVIGRVDLPRVRLKERSHPRRPSSAGAMRRGLGIHEDSVRELGMGGVREARGGRLRG